MVKDESSSHLATTHQATPRLLFHECKDLFPGNKNIPACLVKPQCLTLDHNP